MLRHLFSMLKEKGRQHNLIETDPVSCWVPDGYSKGKKKDRENIDQVLKDILF